MIPTYRPHVFIEAPVGGDPFLRDQMAFAVRSLTKLLKPFNRDRQLIPVSVWRKEILDNGVANKSDAVDWARTNYPKAYAQLGVESHDVAEALAIMTYGRRVVNRNLRHPLAGLKEPRDALAPQKRKAGKHPPKYQLDRHEGTGPPERAGRWPDALPTDPPWPAIRKCGGDTLAGIVRAWASCYGAVDAHCHDQPALFSARSIAKDARVRVADVTPYLDALVVADLAYVDTGCYVFRPVVADSIYSTRDADEPIRRDGEKRRTFYNLFGALFAPYMSREDNWSTRKRWARGGDGVPALLPSHWARTDWRAHHDARYGKEPCQGCLTYALAEGEEFCDLCLAGQERRAEQDARDDKQATAERKERNEARTVAESAAFAVGQAERELERVQEIAARDGNVTPDDLTEAADALTEARGYETDTLEDLAALYEEADES